MNRRTFVSSLAAASAAAAASSASRLFAAEPKPRLKVGLIGCGWFGNEDLERIRTNGSIEVVSLCDVNAEALSSTLKIVGGYQSSAPKTYSNYRAMLEAAHHDIVIVGTPDHWHALPAIAAMKAGADVLLEKPISVDVLEGEALIAAARKYNRVVQVNLQRRTSPVCREAREKYLDTEKLGKIGLVECYFYGSGQSKRIPTATPPAHLDYDFWCGPAPMVDYVNPIASRGWRAYMEYGNGYAGDMGVHIFDMVRMMLDLKWPESISSTGGIYMSKEATANRSDTQRSVFRYADLDVSWEHRDWGKSPIPQRHWSDQWGARFVGQRGSLNVTTLGYEFTPAGNQPSEGRHFLSPTNNLENVVFDKWGDTIAEISGLHAKNFLEACASRSRPNADIEEGHLSSACCILANLATELGRTLAYDPATRSIPGDEEATRRLARPYRSPWIHPDPLTV